MCDMRGRLVGRLCRCLVGRLACVDVDVALALSLDIHVDVDVDRDRDIDVTT